MDNRGACALYYQYDIHRNGKLKKRSRRRISHSFLTAFAQMLYLKMVCPTSRSITDTGSSSRTITNWCECNVVTAATTTTEGLVVGTGTNAVALADVALQTKIAHGTSAGTLQYGASVVNLPTSDSTSTSLIMTRVFTNGSGGTITVREIGAYATFEGSFLFCIMRDLATIALANGDQLTLNYIMKTTV